LIFVGLLAPLETLGWWAGWYSDEVDTDSSSTLASVSADEAAISNHQPSRYLIYLDGVSQFREAYTPDVVEFLQTLPLK
jgi:hypothetical protein